MVARWQRWVSGRALAMVRRGPTPQGLDEDRARIEAGLVDPFEA